MSDLQKAHLNTWTVAMFEIGTPDIQAQQFFQFLLGI